MTEMEPDALRLDFEDGGNPMFGDNAKFVDLNSGEIVSIECSEKVEKEPLYSSETIEEAIERKLNEMLEKTDQAGAHLYSGEQDDALAAFKEELKEVFSE